MRLSKVEEEKGQSILWLAFQDPLKIKFTNTKIWGLLQYPLFVWGTGTLKFQEPLFTCGSGLWVLF